MSPLFSLDFLLLFEVDFFCLKLNTEKKILAIQIYFSDKFSLQINYNF